MKVRFIVNKHFQVSYDNDRVHNGSINSAFTEGICDGPMWQITFIYMKV